MEHYYCIEFKGKGLDKPDTYKLLVFKTENLMMDYIEKNEDWGLKYWTFIQPVDTNQEYLVPKKG